MIKDMENKERAKEPKTNQAGMLFCPYCNYWLYEITPLLRLMKSRKERYLHCPQCGGIVDIDKIKVDFKNQKLC